MNFELFLMEILKEQFEDRMKVNYELTDEEVDEFFKDSDGEYYNDGDFIDINKEKIFTEELLEDIHMFITKVSVLTEENLKELVAYLSSQYYINHYSDVKNKPVLSYLANVSIEELVNQFNDNAMFGMDLLQSFYKNAIEQEKFYANKESIKKDGNGEVLDKFYNICIPQKIVSLNNLLRNVICNLYNYYISIGYSDNEALELTWYFFFNDFDPLQELESMGFSIEEKEFYKRYALGLIIGDLYEDTTNTPLVNTDRFEGRIAQVLPVFLATFGTVQIPEDPFIRGRMLKYFILLQDNPEKKKSNREKTYNDGRELTLKKVNPLYQLDELTF